MSLADWFRRHRNVFSISTPEVDANVGDADMLVEEYRDRATEARRPIQIVGNNALGTSVGSGVSFDEIADGDASPDSAS